MHSTTESVTRSSAGKYLTVCLADESYGIAVMKIREIIRQQKVTHVPRLPEFVKGVINLRGQVIPIIDLRVKLGIQAALTDRACIVVVSVDRAAATALRMGLIVDGVEEVVHLGAADIAPSPSFGTAVRADYLLGLAKVKDRIKPLLDIDRVLAADDLQLLGQMA